MKWYLNLKTSMKLIFAFSVLAILLVLVGIFGLYNMQQIKNDLQFMYNERLIPIRELSEAEIIYQQIRVNIRDMNFIANAPEEKQKFEQNITTLRAQVEEKLKNYNKSQPQKEEQDLLNKLTPAWQEYLKWLDHAIQAAHQGDIEEYKRIAPDFKKAGDVAQEILQELITLDTKYAEQTSIAGEASFNTSRNTTIGLIIAAVIFSVGCAFLISRIIANPLVAMAKAAQKIADGDLRVEQIVVKTRDEIGALGDAFNRMVHDLRNVIMQIREASLQVATSSEELTAGADQTTQATEQISSATQQLADGAENQLQSVNQAASAVNQMTAAISRVNSNTEEVSKLADDASRAAQDGVTSIIDVLAQMNEINSNVQDTAIIIKNLGDRSTEIGNIVRMITDIASQTNLLALNAAIEAARAGEMGRGFAVVADEVRKLAEESAQSADQIKDLITVIQKETGDAGVSMQQGTEMVKDGLQKTEQVNRVFQLIQESVTTVTGKIQEVSTEIDQMANGSEQIVGAIHVVSRSAEETSSASQQTSAASQEQLATMEQVGASAQSLAKLAENMQMLLLKFKL